MQSAEEAASAAITSPPATATPGTAKLFICPSCSSSFTRRHDLTRHCLTLHSSDRPHRCPLCPLSFALPHLLRDHSATHRPPSAATSFPCPHCPLSFCSRRSRQRHAQSHGGGRHRCGVDGCERVFVTRYAMRAHQRTHRQPGDDSGVWTCGECGKALSSERTLKGHLQREHTRDDDGQERVAKRRQQQRSSLPLAGYRLFSAESSPGEGRPHLCGCGRAFANAANLARHRRTACPLTRTEAQQREDDSLSV